MIDSASLARKHGLRLHTHLCETIDEQEHCIERFGKGRLNSYLSGDGLGMMFGSHMEFIFRKEITLLGEEGTELRIVPHQTPDSLPACVRH